MIAEQKNVFSVKESHPSDRVRIARLAPRPIPARTYFVTMNTVQCLTHIYVYIYSTSFNRSLPWWFRLLQQLCARPHHFSSEHYAPQSTHILQRKGLHVTHLPSLTHAHVSASSQPHPTSPQLPQKLNLLLPTTVVH